MPDQLIEQVLKEIGEARRDIAKQSIELAKNTVQTTNVADQLTKLNGTVARHERENIAFTAAIEALKAHQASQDAKDSNKSTRTQDYVDWIVKAAIGLLALLAYKVLVTTGLIQNFLN